MILDTNTFEVQVTKGALRFKISARLFAGKPMAPGFRLLVAVSLASSSSQFRSKGQFGYQFWIPVLDIGIHSSDAA